MKAVAVALMLLAMLGVVFFFYFYCLRRKQLQEEKSVLAITLPRDNEATPFAAEQLFSALHGILKPWYLRLWCGQEHLSFEIFSRGDVISFYVWCHSRLKDLVEKQIYAQYPDAEIEETEPYLLPYKTSSESHCLSVAELKLTKHFSYPIKTFKDFINSDPLAGVTNALTKLGGGEALIQLLVKPAGSSWQKKGYEVARAIRERKENGLITPLLNELATILIDVIQGLFSRRRPVQSVEGLSVEHTETEKMILDAIEGKIAKLGFYFKLSVVCSGRSKEESNRLLQNVLAAFKQYNIGGLNGFKRRIVWSKQRFMHQLNSRYFPVSNFFCGILNIEELSSLWHMPNKDIGTPGIKWSGAKKAPIPSLASEEGIVLVKSRFRGEARAVRIKPYDEAAHIWVVGKTRTGKTTCIKGQALQHIEKGDGVILIDLHGDLYQETLGLMPKERKEDLYLVDLSDTEYPVGFNMLELKRHTPEEKVLIIDELVGVFRKIFADNWGPSTDDVFRMSASAVIDYGEGTILDMLQMISNESFRRKVIPHIKSQVVRDYWANSFSSLDRRTKSAIVNPPLNKLRRFLGNESILNIVGQAKSTFDIRKIMDKGKILLVNLAKGVVGEENAVLLGAMLVSKIQLVAMSRVDLEPPKRKQCFIYLDEFQNFVTEGIATLLSESAKYGVTLILANQYPSQLREDIRRAVLGNVGTLICFQLSAEEAENIAKEFEPTITANDLVNLDRFNCYVKLRVDAKATKPFSGVTIPWPKEPDKKLADKMRKASRKKIARKREEVEKEIQRRLIKESIQENREQKAKEIAFELGVKEQWREIEPLVERYSSEVLEKAKRAVIQKENIKRPFHYFKGVLQRMAKNGE